MKLSCVLPGHLATMLVKMPGKSSNVYYNSVPAFMILRAKHIKNLVKKVLMDKLTKKK